MNWEIFSIRLLLDINVCLLIYMSVLVMTVVNIGNKTGLTRGNSRKPFPVASGSACGKRVVGIFPL